MTSDPKYIVTGTLLEHNSSTSRITADEFDVGGFPVHHPSKPKYQFPMEFSYTSSADSPHQAVSDAYKSVEKYGFDLADLTKVYAKPTPEHHDTTYLYTIKRDFVVIDEETGATKSMFTVV